MNEAREAIVVGTEADADALTTVKPNCVGSDVVERFRRLKEDVDGTWLLLKLDDTVIGWCVVVWSGKKTHPECPDMQDLFVRAEHRNRGYGTRLISEVERMAKARGHNRLGVAVNPDDNTAARRLYERLGYRHDGGAKYLDGVYGDYEDWVIDLEKQLV